VLIYHTTIANVPHYACKIIFVLRVIHSLHILYIYTIYIYAIQSFAYSSAQSVMNLNHLYSITHGYINEGLAPTTRCTYSAGQQSFTTFCNTSRSRVLSATESALLLFISHLASKNIFHTTIKVFLADVRHIHVIAGMLNPFEEQFTPRLQLTFRGIKRTQAIVIPCRAHLPITLHIMHAIKDYLSKQLHSPSNIMLLAACCLVCFGFLRVSEFTVPCYSTYDPGTHLSLTDTFLDNRDGQSTPHYSIHQTVKDRFFSEESNTIPWGDQSPGLPSSWHSGKGTRSKQR